MATAGLAVRMLSGNATPSARAAYRVAPYAKTAVPTARQLHLMNRLGTGFSVAAFRQMTAAGGETAWFERQLDPASVSENARGAAVPGWFPDLRRSPAEIWQTDQGSGKPGWEYARDLCNAALLRRTYSSRSVLESMVEFWSNHLHVDANHFPAFTVRSSYDDVIREHALGRFEDMLVAATLHPAMLLFLDNWKSVKNNPNENHGRELLELHTVGRDAGYTEQMVKDSAKILSGWTVVRDTWVRQYDANRHTTGAVTVLGFSRANSAADGSAVTEQYLRYLANHPATAQRICRKLAIRFVSDDPPAALVDRLAAVYLDSGTDIKPVLRALVAREEFWASAGQQVRTSMDDCIATLRALDVRASGPTGLSSFANELCWTLNSTLAFQWPRPDGPPERAGAWASTTRMLNSFRMHWNIAGGWWPNGEVTYRKPASFLPQKRVRFDQFVDHLCRVVLGRKSTSRILRAACEGIDVAPGEVITAKHAVISWKFPRLLAVLLDSPAHMSR